MMDNQKSETINIPMDPLNREYRDILVYVIDNAREEILTYVGEIGAYRFYDIRSSAEYALERGVNVAICAYEPSTDLINRTVARGAKLYLSPSKPEEKFMVVDKRHVFVSASKGRMGTLYLNAEELAKQYSDKFWAVANKLDPVSVHEVEDPLLTLFK